MCWRDRKFQCPGLINFEFTGNVCKCQVRDAGVIEELIIQKYSVHYKHPLRNENVMLLAPVTDTLLSKG